MRGRPDGKWVASGGYDGAVRVWGAAIRQIRALSALEWAGTDEARGVLEGLSKGADGVWLTEEARAALVRLKRRTGR